MRRQKTNYKSTWIFILIFLLVIFSSCIAAEETVSDPGIITEETETDQEEMYSATEPSNTAQTTTVPVTTSPTTTVSITTSAPITIAPPVTTSAPIITNAPVTTSAPVTTEAVKTTPVTTVPITTEPVTTAPVTKAPETTTTVTHDYVLNKNTKKFHWSHCSSANKISDKNKDYFTGTRPDIMAKGYEPCGICKP